MALFNESLQARFNAIIRRLHSTRDAPAPQISPEIGHNIILEMDRPEFHVLGGGFLWAGRQNVAAVALNFGQVGVRNPTGSGLLVVVTLLRVTNATPVAASYQLRTRPQAAIAATNTSFHRDSRRGFGGGAPVLTLADNTSPAIFGVGPLEIIEILAGEGERDFESVPYVLTPGFELILACSAVNTAMDADFAGYARPITPEDTSQL